MAYLKQYKFALSIRDENTGALKSGATVELSKDGMDHALTEAGTSGFYVIDSLYQGQYFLKVDGALTGQSYTVGGGELENEGFSSDSIYVSTADSIQLMSISEFNTLLGNSSVDWVNIENKPTTIENIDSELNTLDAKIDSHSHSDYALLDGNGKIVTSQVPKLSITETFSCASEAEMLALDAETGDVCVRTDETKTYILSGSDPAVLGDWVQLASSSNGVNSVDGQNGDVDLSGSYIAKDSNLPPSEQATNLHINGYFAVGSGATSMNLHSLGPYPCMDGFDYDLKNSGASVVEVRGSVFNVTGSLQRGGTDVSLVNHNHDTDYADISHTHDYSGSFAPLSHTHNYASSSHTHSEYSLTSHTHDYIPRTGSGWWTDANYTGGSIAFQCSNNASNVPESYISFLHVHPGSYQRSFQIGSSYGGANKFWMRGRHDNTDWKAWERLITDKYATFSTSIDTTGTINAGNFKAGTRSADTTYAVVGHENFVNPADNSFQSLYKDTGTVFHCSRNGTSLNLNAYDGSQLYMRAYSDDNAHFKTFLMDYNQATHHIQMYGNVYLGNQFYVNSTSTFNGQITTNDKIYGGSSIHASTGVYGQLGSFYGTGTSPSQTTQGSNQLYVTGGNNMIRIGVNTDTNSRKAWFWLSHTDYASYGKYYGTIHFNPVPIGEDASQYKGVMIGGDPDYHTGTGYALDVYKKSIFRSTVEVSGDQTNYGEFLLWNDEGESKRFRIRGDWGTGYEYTLDFLPDSSNTRNWFIQSSSGGEHKLTMRNTGTGYFRLETDYLDANLSISSTGSVTAGNARIGTWTGSSNYARFGHSSFNVSAGNGYGFLQSNAGDCWVEGKSSVTIRAGTDIINVTSTGANVTGTLTTSSTLTANGSTYLNSSVYNKGLMHYYAGTDLHGKVYASGVTHPRTGAVNPLTILSESGHNILLSANEGSSTVYVDANALRLKDTTCAINNGAGTTAVGSDMFSVTTGGNYVYLVMGHRDGVASTQATAMVSVGGNTISVSHLCGGNVLGFSVNGTYIKSHGTTSGWNVRWSYIRLR